MHTPIPYSGTFLKGLIFKNFESSQAFWKYFFKINNIIIMHMHFQKVLYSAPRKMELLKYFKCIKPSKEERIQSVLPKLHGSLACLMPSSAIEAANNHLLIALYMKF